LSELPTRWTRLLRPLSVALDFTYQGLSLHHLRVARAADSLARALSLPLAAREQLAAAALVHDIGALTFEEKEALHRFEVEEPFAHAARGAAFLHSVPGLEKVADIVLCHHDRWSGPNQSSLEGEAIPWESRVIHLCDRLDVLLDYRRNVLDQAEGVLKALASESGRLFDPRLTRELERLARAPAFWLDLVVPEPWLSGDEMGGDAYQDNGVPLPELAAMLARLVDSKSPFTHRHSAGVAVAAATGAALLGFDAEGVQRARMAGLLHDLGKLSVPEAVLNKPGPLDRRELNLVRGHSYYTYRILCRIPETREIAAWAGYHHERLDGRGYPFGLAAPEIDTGARLLAAADVFVALVEDRPYRASLPRAGVEAVMREAVRSGALDAAAVDVLLGSCDELIGRLRRLGH